jgi:hypothetical protein
LAYTEWLAAAKNLDELKTLYRGLARQHHPDLGGATSTMQEINAEYDLRTKLFQAGYSPVTAATPARPSTSSTGASPRTSPKKRKTHQTNPNAKTEWGRLNLSKEEWEAYRAVCQMRDSDPYPWGLVVEIYDGKVRVRGKATYYYRESLKARGFVWNSTKRYWYFVKKPAQSKAS